MPSLPFPIGQKVVCVHGHFPAAVFEHFDRVPQENCTYTVSEIICCREYATDRPGFSVRLAELPPIMPGTGCFSLWRFRWLTDEKTSAAGMKSPHSLQPDVSTSNPNVKPKPHPMNPHFTGIAARPPENPYFQKNRDTFEKRSVRWLNDMIALKGKSDIGGLINTQIMQALIDANSSFARTDFPDFKDPNKLGEGEEMVGRPTNLVAIFQKPELDFSKNRADNDEILGDAYEYLMRHLTTESSKFEGQL
jgi:hypothetical protein